MLRNSLLIITTVAVALLVNGYAVETADGLQIGEKVPPFAANDQDGELWSLTNNLDEQYLVVYFYPAAMTGG